MRILHVYRTYFPDSQGGLEEVIRQICLNSQAHGVESRVFCLSPDAQPRVIRRPEGRVYRAIRDFEVASCSMSRHALPMFKRLVDWADVVHYHFPWPFADFLHFAGQVNKPTVLTYHSDIVRQQTLGKLYNPLMTQFLSAVDRIVCTSPNYFATSDVLSKFPNKVEIVPIGLNEDSYPIPAAAEKAEVEAKFGNNFFLFVGVLRYYKGLHILLDAMANAPYNVVIVGSGPTEKELRAQAEKQGLDNVIFAGYVDDATKVSLFEHCRGVVFPSYLRSEAFGVTLLEGAMYGRPLISTEVGSGTSHVNVDGKTGYVVAPGSPSQLREAMDKLVANPDMAALFGRQARQRYRSLFTGELMGARYVSVYQKLLGVQMTSLDQPQPLYDQPQVEQPKTAGDAT